MRFIKFFVLLITLLIFGAELYAEVGLKEDSLIEVKPKTCDFQWYKGSKSYNANSSTTDKTSDDKTSTTEK